MEWLNEITKGHAPEAIIIFALVLIIRVLLSILMANMAKQKGYNDVLYFFICFIFGIFGYVFTAALPDIRLRAACEELYELLSNKTASDTTDSIIPESDDTRKPSGRKAYMPSADETTSAQGRDSAVERIRGFWEAAEKRKAENPPQPKKKGKKK